LYDFSCNILKTKRFFVWHIWCRVTKSTRVATYRKKKREGIMANTNTAERIYTDADLGNPALVVAGRAPKEVIDGQLLYGVGKLGNESGPAYVTRLELESALLDRKAKSAVVQAVKPDEFKLSITEYREKGKRGPNDKGSKGGALCIQLGNSRIFPSIKLAQLLCSDQSKQDETLEFIRKNAGKFQR
jgi:hypothetical protein